MASLRTLCLPQARLAGSLVYAVPSVRRLREGPWTAAPSEPVEQLPGTSAVRSPSTF
ncbi:MULTISPECIES: hypothetical protein [unclassified Streptomyces]|uniref:hypothetical protein n=1 Tax=unclassified Streptomyces TaxID=2593676 RepID=UPI00381C7E56